MCTHNCCFKNCNTNAIVCLTVCSRITSDSNNNISLVDTKDISALLNLQRTLQIHRHPAIQMLLRLPTYMEADMPGPTHTTHQDQEIQSFLKAALCNSISPHKLTITICMWSNMRSKITCHNTRAGSSHHRVSKIEVSNAKAEGNFYIDVG